MSKNSNRYLGESWRALRQELLLPEAWQRRDATGPRLRRVERFGQAISPSAAKLLDSLIEMSESGSCVISNDNLAAQLRWKLPIITARLRELEHAQLISRHVDRHINRPGKRIIHLLCIYSS
jgi:DNA-binding MarR family transcriptional regulator